MKNIDDFLANMQKDDESPIISAFIKQNRK
jgi:hypothetical protein